MQPWQRQRSLFPGNPDEKLMMPKSPPEAIRRRLLGILQMLREAESFPWPPAKLRSWRIVFPQMASVLPEDEARELGEAFIRELDRWGDEARDED